MSHLLATILVMLTLGLPTASAQEARPLAPMAGKGLLSAHAPYEAGDCTICHQAGAGGKTAALVKSQPALCLDCHEEFARVLKRPNVHAPARAACTTCHNPHNARKGKLLLDEPAALCTSCHGEIRALAQEAKVKHGALAGGSQCANCHDPHGSSIGRLLLAQPFDLCVGCHSVAGMTGADGKKLQNVKAWLQSNPVWHGPLGAKDCSGCHAPHGGEHFRLLKDPYPPEFYAPYDARTYALCTSCHDERAFSTAKTTTLTSFRNGEKNLHFLHLNQGSRGRTCRACHEVHASKQEHHLREGVPYGSGGWILKLNYRKTADGGTCEKTCHQERTYAIRGK